MSQDQWKQEVGEAAVDYVRDDCVLGVGTGSTVNAFIEALGKIGMVGA